MGFFSGRKENKLAKAQRALSQRQSALEGDAMRLDGDYKLHVNTAVRLGLRGDMVRTAKCPAARSACAPRRDA